MRVLAEGATLRRVSRVALPPHVALPIEVFVNGVRQREGSDYRLEGRSLVFERSLEREGRLGFWRWLSMFLGLVDHAERHVDGSTGRRPPQGEWLQSKYRNR